MPANPWAHSRNEAEFAEPDYPEMETGRYTAPSIDDDAPYNDEFGWSAPLRLSAQEIPDNARLGQRPLRDFRPTPGEEVPETFYERRDADEAQRHSVEDVDADGWTESKGVTASDKRWADNPRRTPPPETRPTEQLAPRTYSFTRPFGHTLAKMGARFFTGEHFSMADHRRNYEILGMAPASSRRNTWRIEPTPWDADIVDVPANVGPINPQGRIQAVDVDYSTRNWRLS